MKFRVREVQFDLKKHGLEKREKAVRLIEQGYGKASLASALAISVGIAEKWIHAYRAIGKEAFLDMGSKRRQYDYETKLAATRDYVDRGMTRQEVMSRYGIANQTQLKQWAKAYREGGPEAPEFFLSADKHGASNMVVCRPKRKFRKLHGKFVVCHGRSSSRP